MVKKTVTSAMKDRSSPLIGHPHTVSEKTKKWLSRAEAGLTNNPNIINEAIAHYDAKYYATNDYDDQMRAYNKGQKWRGMSQVRDQSWEEYLMDGNGRYTQQYNRGPLEDETHARSMKHMWNRDDMYRDWAYKNAKS